MRGTAFGGGGKRNRHSSTRFLLLAVVSPRRSTRVVQTAVSRFGDGADGFVAFGVEAKREVSGALPRKKRKEPMAAVVRDRELVHGGDLRLVFASRNLLTTPRQHTADVRELGGVSGNFPERMDKYNHLGEAPYKMILNERARPEQPAQLAMRRGLVLGGATEFRPELWIRWR